MPDTCDGARVRGQLITLEVQSPSAIDDDDDDDFDDDFMVITGACLYVYMHRAYEYILNNWLTYKHYYC